MGHDTLENNGLPQWRRNWKFIKIRLLSSILHPPGWKEGFPCRTGASGGTAAGLPSCWGGMCQGSNHGWCRAAACDRQERICVLPPPHKEQIFFHSLCARLLTLYPVRKKKLKVVLTMTFIRPLPYTEMKGQFGHMPTLETPNFIFLSYFCFILWLIHFHSIHMHVLVCLCLKSIAGIWKRGRRGIFMGTFNSKEHWLTRLPLKSKIFLL